MGQRKALDAHRRVRIPHSLMRIPPPETLLLLKAEGDNVSL